VNPARDWKLGAIQMLMMLWINSSRKKNATIPIGYATSDVCDAPAALT